MMMMMMMMVMVMMMMLYISFITCRQRTHINELCYFSSFSTYSALWHIFDAAQKYVILHPESYLSSVLKPGWVAQLLEAQGNALWGAAVRTPKHAGSQVGFCELILWEMAS